MFLLVTITHIKRYNELETDEIDMLKVGNFQVFDLKII